MKFIHQTPLATSQDRPEIEYPCSWIYKVIGEAPSLLGEAITTACWPHAVHISHSRSSSKGKYHSINAEIIVPDEATRLKIYDELKNNPAVKIVL